MNRHLFTSLIVIEVTAIKINIDQLIQFAVLSTLI